MSYERYSGLDKETDEYIKQLQFAFGGENYFEIEKYINREQIRDATFQEHLKAAKEAVKNFQGL